jgi:hypothetical protein
VRNGKGIQGFPRFLTHVVTTASIALLLPAPSLVLGVVGRNPTGVPRGWAASSVVCSFAALMVILLSFAALGGFLSSQSANGSLQTRLAGSGDSKHRQVRDHYAASFSAALLCLATLGVVAEFVISA